MNDFLSEYFSTTRLIPLRVADLTPVAQDVAAYFRAQEYTVGSSRLAEGWHISIHKGDGFKALLGLKTALNIRIEPRPEGTFVSAGIGIFDTQVLPTMITVFVFAPVVLGQIWGIVQQNQLDEEAVRYVEDRLAFYSGQTPQTTDADARRAAEAELGDPAF